jgi:hypothetical protein
MPGTLATIGAVAAGIAAIFPPVVSFVVWILGHPRSTVAAEISPVTVVRFTREPEQASQGTPGGLKRAMIGQALGYLFVGIVIVGEVIYLGYTFVSASGIDLTSEDVPVGIVIGAILASFAILEYGLFNLILVGRALWFALRLPNGKPSKASVGVDVVVSTDVESLLARCEAALRLVRARVMSIDLDRGYIQARLDPRFGQPALHQWITITLASTQDQRCLLRVRADGMRFFTFSTPKHRNYLLTRRLVDLILWG